MAQRCTLWNTSEWRLGEVSYTAKKFLKFDYLHKFLAKKTTKLSQCTCNGTRRSNLMHRTNTQKSRDTVPLMQHTIGFCTVFTILCKKNYGEKMWKHIREYVQSCLLGAKFNFYFSTVISYEMNIKQFIFFFKIHTKYFHVHNAFLMEYLTFF